MRSVLIANLYNQDDVAIIALIMLVFTGEINKDVGDNYPYYSRRQGFFSAVTYYA